MSFRAVRGLLVFSLTFFAIQAFAQSADLAVTKNGPAMSGPGTDVAYDVVVVNLGPSAAATVTLTDVIPPGMTFTGEVQNTGPAFSCTLPSAGTNGTISCTLATLTNGTSADFTFTLHIAPATPPGTFFSNTATVTTATNDPNPENDSSTASTQTPSNNADVGVNKSGPASAGPNTNVTYNISVVNNGPATASTVSLNDTLPGTMTFVSNVQNSGPAFSCTTPAPGAGGTITCSIASLASGVNATFTLVGHVPTGTPSGTTFSNTASVTSVQDPTPENDSSTVNTTVSTVDLAMTKSGPATANAGTNVVYTITITNNGPDNATSAQFTDTLPPQTSFVSLVHTSGSTGSCTSPGTPTGGSAGCFFSVFNNGATATYTLTVFVPITTPDGTIITNTVTATSDQFDTNNSNDTASTSATVIGATDLSVTKSGPASTAAGSNISYTITVANGAAPANNVQLTDATPAGTTFVSNTQNSGPAASCTTPAPGGTGTITCSWASLNASAAFTLVVKTSGGATGTVSNTANVTSSTSDPNPANNTSTANTTLTVSSDVAVTKSGPASAPLNTDVAYTITVTNNGPSNATTVAMNDPLPAGTTFVSISQSGPAFSCTTPAVGATGTVNCTIATLASGAFTQFTLTVHTTTPGGFTNTATVSSGSSDPNPNNNSASASTNVPAADLSISKTASPAPYGTGMPITWTITVTNTTAAAPSNGVSVSDTLPPGTTFVSATPSQGSCSGTTTVTCSLGTINGSASATIALTATLPSTPGPITNTATVTATTPDPNPANNTASSTVTVIPAAQIPAISPALLALLAALLAAIALMKR